MLRQDCVDPKICLLLVYQPQQPSSTSKGGSIVYPENNRLVAVKAPSHPYGCSLTNKSKAVEGPDCRNAKNHEEYVDQLWDADHACYQDQVSAAKRVRR